MSRINHKEDDEQKALFTEAGYYSELKWLHSIPNGGRRDAREGARLKRQGVRAGVLDIFLPKARGIYHGLYIEMKYGNNTLSENQEKFAINAANEGYCVFVCYSANEAMASIKLYLKLNNDGSILPHYPSLLRYHIA